jgi:hypothetical protein
MSRVIVDPEVPAKDRRALEEAPSGVLPGFSAAPERGGDGWSALLATARTWLNVLVDRWWRRARAAKRLLRFVLGLWAVNLTGTIVGSVYDLNKLFGVLLACAAVGAVAGGCWARNRNNHAVRRQRKIRRGLAAARRRHRRYVIPNADLSPEARVIWDQAKYAARQIRASDAVRDGLIDSVEVGAVLPYHLWDIAERLALLSGPQSRQDELVRHLDTSDPEVSAIVAPQRQVRDLALADIRSRVTALTEFALLAVKADTAENRKRALDELATLNPDYQELLAKLDVTGNALSPQSPAADQLRYIAAAAAEAVRQANEAGRSLTLPSWPTPGAPRPR